MFFTPSLPRAKTVRETVREEIDDTLGSDEENLGEEIGKISSVREAAHSERERQVLKQLASKGAEANALHAESRPLPKGFANPAVAAAPVFDAKYRLDWYAPPGPTRARAAPRVHRAQGPARCVRRADGLRPRARPAPAATARSAARCRRS